jgi:hypothetical protein
MLSAAPIIIDRELIDVHNVITPRLLMPILIIHGKNFSIITTGPVRMPFKGRDKSFVVQRFARGNQMKNFRGTVARRSGGRSHVYDNRIMIGDEILLGIKGGTVRWCGILFLGICALEGNRLFGLFLFRRHGDQV